MRRVILSLAALTLASTAALAGGTTFTVVVHNVSTDKTLRLSTGGTAPAPTSPVLWVVHGALDSPVFRSGALDRGKGLEALAEDGNPAPLVASLTGMKGVRSAGAVDTPTGDDKPGPATPDKSFTFEVTAEKGDHLTLAMMFGQSNDLFYAPQERGIALFDTKGMPVRGDFTSSFLLWDAGTEVNEEPGVGRNQGPRQGKWNTGPSEKRAVQRVRDRFTYPRTADVIHVTITPPDTAAHN